MPILPRNRSRYEQDLAETEERLDRWINEVDTLLSSASTADLLRTSARIVSIRTSFATMREGTNAHAS